MKIVYRISDVGFNKLKPEYISNENCLKNALDVFSIEKHQWLVIADSVSDDTKNMIESYIDKQFIDYVFIKKGPGYPFLYSLDKPLIIPCKPDYFQTHTIVWNKNIKSNHK